MSDILPESYKNNNNEISDFATFEHSFFYRVHIAWNNLPLDIRKMSILSMFKHNVTKYLWESILRNAVAEAIRLRNGNNLELDDPG